ncbi:hypothetical protein [Nitrospirillum iridis]|uniref:hypothetical protein n=1 Tax=Nitrospirillum iridis TaxID=765888 RepID=UPI001622A4CF|nr:hypothetical protein [Nitrospirillum iridis]
MNDDLQNPPEEVVHLFRHARDGGHDVVHAYYERKRHSAFGNVGSAFASRPAPNAGHSANPPPVQLSLPVRFRRAGGLPPYRPLPLC